MLFFRTGPGSRLKKLQWLPYVAFFLYTLIKNIRTHDNLIWILLAEALALLTLAVFAIVSLFVVQCPYNLPTAAEKEVEDAKLRAEFQERKRREAEELEKLRAENRAAEQARLQAEKDRRTHEAYERIVLGKKPRASDTSYGTSGDSYDYIDKRERVGASGLSCCDNCRYYDGNYCTCQESLSYNTKILTATAYVCGYHRD
jgi:serine phosphatase RsbU (regulator of sigma subunit)